MRRQRFVLPAAFIVAAAWLTSCAREEATEPLLPDVPAPSGDVARDDIIPGQYIVVFKDDVANPRALANQLASSHKLTLRHTYQHSIRGFSAEMSDAALAALQSHPSVSFIEPNRYWYIDTHEVLRKRAVAGYAAAMAAVPPAAPSNLVATAAGSNQIDVTWQDNAVDETRFDIERRLGQTGTFVKIAEVGANVTNFSDTGLAADTEQCYRVRAVKAAGRATEFSGYSNIGCATTDPGPPPPPPPPSDAPSNLVTTAVSSSQIDLTYTDNKGDENGFEIERAFAPGGPFTKIGEVGANVTNFSNTGLAADTEHCYRVRAFKTVGRGNREFTDYSNVDCATTLSGPPPPPPPPSDAPSDLVATAVSSSQIDLTYTDNKGDESGFEVDRAFASGGPFAKIAELGPNTTNYSNFGLAAETEHCYRVRAFTTVGRGEIEFTDYSNVDCATTLAAPPPPPPPEGCDDNGTHDALTNPGLWGIVKVKANLNPHWLGVRGNDPAQCGMRAWFFGLDSGVDLDHPDLNVNVAGSLCFLSGCNSAEDDNGHGSHTAGTAAAIDGGPANGVVGVAPGALIHAFKVCNSGGSCPLDAIINAVDEVTARKNANPGQPMVANMSLGGGASPSIDNAVRGSVSAGVVYTLSAGNGVFNACQFPDDAQDSSPARVGDDDIVGQSSNGDTKRVNGAITVTSSGQSDADVNCNYGNPVTVAAPGEGIRSTWENGGYATISGTSMAAPHAAGAAILVLQGNQGLTPTQVEQEMMNDLDNWTTNDLPNADGRLDARCLGTGVADCVGNN